MALGRRVLAVIAALGCSAAFSADMQTVEVDCSKDRSISHALSSGSEKKALVIVVRGTCNESVTIDRDDVTLRADAAGGGIRGPDPEVSTVTVTGHRVTLEGLTVSGGRNGIVGSGAVNLTVRNATVESTGRNGIVYIGSSSGTIDHCIVRSNPRDGVSVDTASVTVINSTIRENARFGMLVTLGGSARIGITLRNEAAGNIISQNLNSGITFGSGATALIVGNEITNNGGQGISMTAARVEVAGLNTIRGNNFQGVFASVGSSVLIGSPTFDFSNINTISGNGGTTSAGGVFVNLGSSALIRDAVVSGNNGAGLALSLRSQAQMSGTTIQGNSLDGIRLTLGSALLPLMPRSTVSGNGNPVGFGIQCFDTESSIVNMIPTILSLAGNTSGEVGPLPSSCTPF